MSSFSSPLNRSDLKKSSIGMSRPSQSFLIVEIVTLLFLPLTMLFTVDCVTPLIVQSLLIEISRSRQSWTVFTPRRQLVCGIGGRWDAPPSPCGEGHSPAPQCESPDLFQSTLPVWGGTAESRPPSPEQQFQSTLPVWGGTSASISDSPCPQDFNPPSPCGEGLFGGLEPGHAHVISIHPPRVGRDIGSGRGLCHSAYFNPPSPCGEGRVAQHVTAAEAKFQSTLPMWGGTKGTGSAADAYAFQSTLPVWGGTVGMDHQIFKQVISIHPPRVERDVLRRQQLRQRQTISIHPPRVGRDWTDSGAMSRRLYFNPPSTCGEGPGAPLPDHAREYFNPPSPCGEGPIWDRNQRTVY